MNIEEMTESIGELVGDPEKASVIFKTILESRNPDIIQRALELYVLLILHHGDEIQKALEDEHDKEDSYEQIINRLEKEILEIRKDNEYSKHRDRWAKKQSSQDFDDYVRQYPYPKPKSENDYAYLQKLLKDNDPPF